jgi:hypothetical protein
VLSAVEQAVVLWSRGLNVIPVPRPDARHDGKRPAIAWGEYQSRRQSEPEVRRLFGEAQSNIAIVTGNVSGVVVVDVDSPSAMEFAVLHLPYTPWQTKTSKGFHLFYRHPGTRVGNRVGVQTPLTRLALDVRGDGGFVIAPGSLHASGAEYLQAGDWAQRRDDLPLFSADWLSPRRHHAPCRVVIASGDVISRARRYLAAIPVPEIGGGSDAVTFYSACRLVRGFDLDPEDVELLLWEWVGGRPGWTPDWIVDKVRHAVRYGTEPVGALR